VAVIVSTGVPHATAAALAATKTIPVVFITGTDPVKLGWVLNRPGGNVTGVSFLSNGLEAKRLGLLHDTVTRVTVVGVLLNPENPTSQQQTKDLNDAAHSLGLTLHFANVARESDVEPAFNSVLQRGAQAIAVTTDGGFLAWPEQFVAQTARARIPAIFHDREFAARGGLSSYGASITAAGTPELDSELLSAFPSAPLDVTRSIDAVARLIESELPGWWWTCGYCTLPKSP
jgi:ABC-type uncharacterized transport system substrate-binding protein